jgi:hypothetical protein
MPVLALAIVVEARATMAKWVPEGQRASKSIQGFLWGVPLVVYGIAIPVCLFALAGSDVWSGWVTVIPIAMSLGTGSLILAPALEFFVKSNARSAAYVNREVTLRGETFYGSVIRFRAWRLKRKALRTKQVADWQEIELRAVRHALVDGGVGDFPEIEPLLLMIEEKVQMLRNISQKSAGYAAEVINIFDKHAAKRAGIRRAALDDLEQRISGTLASAEAAAKIDASAQRHSAT